MVATRAEKCPTAGRSVVLGYPGRGVAWLKLASYGNIQSWKLALKRLNGEIDEEEVPIDKDVPNIESVELLLQRDAGSTQEISTVALLVVSAWGEFKGRVGACANCDCDYRRKDVGPGQ